MLIRTPSRLLVARDPVDFRRSISGLAAVCEVHRREQPLDGSPYVFVNRRRNGLKMLIWSYHGLVMRFKKLERGRFRCSPLDADRGTMSPVELAALMERIDLSRARRLSRWNPKKLPIQTDPTS